ncbi:MAG: DUF305 domain-containing protein [Cyanobacteriota bacterium]|nr:DUF305 domain-containing protein [Cyanobacteriota bacterium]
MRHAPATLVVLALLAPIAHAQADPHQHHRHHQATPAAEPVDHGTHADAIGPAGNTYDLRWLDAMVQHHVGALRMSEFVFNIGSSGVGALATAIWREQAREIKAMGQWRKAWYPEAPVYPVAPKSGGDPNSLSGLERMSTAQIQAIQMMDSTPTRDNRVVWFLEGMIAHHGGALEMAHDALKKSTNPTVRRLAREIIVAQRAEIIELRRMLRLEGFDKPQYSQ